MLHPTMVHPLHENIQQSPAGAQSIFAEWLNYGRCLDPCWPSTQWVLYMAWLIIMKPGWGCPIKWISSNVRHCCSWRAPLSCVSLRKKKILPINQQYFITSLIRSLTSKKLQCEKGCACKNQRNAVHEWWPFTQGQWSIQGRLYKPRLLNFVKGLCPVSMVTARKLPWFYGTGWQDQLSKHLRRVARGTFPHGVERAFWHVPGTSIIKNESTH